MPFFRILILCFFVSGATGLIYEVVWVRLLSLVFGNTVYAVGVVLTAFMSGLSLGSYLIGRWADRRGNMLKLYGILEAGIALLAVLSPLLLGGVTSVYRSAFNTAMPLWALSGLRYFLSAAVLLVPTTLMGGTLPVLSRHFVRSEAELEKRVGTLYSINTVGGVLGAFLVGFVLLRFFGMGFTIRFAAVINLCIGAVAFFLGTKMSDVPRVAGPAGRDEAGPAARPAGYRYALLAFFLSGLSAMVYEVAWSRLLVAVIGSTTYAFSLILMGFLLGIGLGSLVVSSVSEKRKLGLEHFSAIQVAIGVVCFFTVALFNLLPSLMLRGLSLMGESLDGILGVEFLVVLLYILIPTTLFGATFPIVAGIYNDGSSRRGGNIGRIYAANTAGCILGSTVAAFVLLPGLGSALSIKAAAALNILVAAAGFAVLGRPRLFFASAALLALPLLPVHVSQELLNSGVAIYGKDSDYSLNSPDSILLYSKEGLNATISVVTKPDGNMVLRTNGKADASTVDDMSTQVALGYFPLLLHQRPEKVLVIGFGSGSTVKAVEDFPGVTGIDCIEIEPAVLEAAEFFREVNGGAHRSPRVRMIVDDARNQIIASGRRYDVIISEPSNPWISGIGNLFSREFYEASLSRLNKGGIFCQWVQLYRMRQEDLRMILRTFSSVFTDVSVWQSGPGDILLMGSGERMGAFQKRAVAQRLTGKVAWDLKAYLNISDATDFFSYFVTDSEGVDAMAAGARVNTDDLPLLEFNAPFSLYAEDAYKSNNMLLLKHTKLPDIAGMGASAHDSAELLYRKSTNYLKLHIPVDPEWVKRTMEFAFARDNPATDYEYAMLMKDSDGKAADFHFERAIALKGDEFDYLYEAAKFRLQRGRAREALDYFFRAHELPHYASEEWRLFGYIALSYRQLGDYRNYVAYLVKSVEANPYNSNAQLALADSYLQNGDRDAACARFEDALKYAPAGDRAALRGKTSRYCRP